jgi:hypothetical protein
LDLLDALIEKNNLLEKKKIKDTDTITATNLAVSYKPRNVAVSIEKC